MVEKQPPALHLPAIKARFADVQRSVEFVKQTSLTRRENRGNGKKPLSRAVVGFVNDVAPERALLLEILDLAALVDEAQLTIPTDRLGFYTTVATCLHVLACGKGNA